MIFLDESRNCKITLLHDENYDFLFEDNWSQYIAYIVNSENVTPAILSRQQVNN